MKCAKFQNIDDLKALGDDFQFDNFLEVFRLRKKIAGKLKKSEYLEEGKYPIVDQGKSFIAGYTDNVSLVNSNNGSIIFGDHTRILKFIDFDFVVGADGVKVIESSGKYELLPKYGYYFLKSLDIPNTGYNRHFKYLKEILVPVPSIDMQRRIIFTLDLIDKAKSSQLNYIEKLENLQNLMVKKSFKGELKLDDKKLEVYLNEKQL